MPNMKKKLFRSIALALVLIAILPSMLPTALAAPEKESLTIGSLPDVLAAQIGDKVSVQLDLTGANSEKATYQWYYANKGSLVFHKSSITTDTYSVKMSEARDGRRIYCIVTDANGAKMRSETVTLKVGEPLVIRQQPKNVAVAAGKSAITSVKASGEGKLTYQWYVKDADSQKFIRSSLRTDTYNITMDPEVNGRQVYCVITDELGQTVTTQIAVVSMSSQLGIYVQPEDAKVSAGQIATVTVAANGSGKLTYQWYVRKPGGSTFHKSAVTGPVYTAKMSDAADGRAVYCVITDEKGNRITSNIVTLSQLSPITVTRQPQEKIANLGDIVSIHVAAKGETELHYQWYVKKQVAASSISLPSPAQSIPCV